MTNEIVTYKGFDKDLQCRGFQYEIGQTYEHDGGVSVCMSGFHACENPLDVMAFYMPLVDGNRFAKVRQSGDTSKDSGGKKVASATIKIDAELTLPDLIKEGVSWLIDHCKKGAASGYGSQLAASGGVSKLAASGDGSQLAASGGVSKLAASGDDSQLAASGYGSKLAASGYGSQLAASGGVSKLAASGDDSKLAASGDDSKLAASGHGSQLAASGYGSKLAASGGVSKLAASGHGSKLAASGHGSKLAASGHGSIISISAYGGQAKAGNNGVFSLAWDDGDRPRISVFYVGEDGIKPDTWYRCENGQAVECEE